MAQGKRSDWEALVRHWHRQATQNSEIRFEDIYLCECHSLELKTKSLSSFQGGRLFLAIRIKRQGDLKNGARVYYHRNRVAYSNPDQFWGYLSTSSDPHDINENLVSKGWEVSYSL